MQFLIDKNELNALQCACAVHELRYFVLPSATQGMVEATVKSEDGKEITQLEAYHLGRTILQAFEIETLRANLPDTTENNVLTLVEDLPG